MTKITRSIYSSLTYLAVPFVFGRFILKGLKNKAYLHRLNERFGFIDLPKDFSCDVWFHAVSVGEVKAISNVVKRLKENRPSLNILLTTTTPTGSDIVKKDLNKYVYHIYFPLDISLVVERFLNKLQPSLVVIAETEIWPNLFYKCYKKRIPLILINARMSLNSYKNYKKIRFFIKNVLNMCDKILARSKEDAKRFLELGADQRKVFVCGDIKFDIEISKEVISKGKELKKEVFGNRFVWIAASTHRGEEEIVLKVHKRLIKSYPNSSLILAPRHPERAEEAIRLCEQMGLKWQRRTNFTEGREFDVYIVDTLGELLIFYSASDVSFVGGSLVNIGGHNLLEPAALGLPVISGKYLSNFEEVKALLNSENALICVEDSTTLLNELLRLIKDPEQRRILGKKAQEVVKKNQGSSSRVVSVIEEYV